MKFLKFRNYLTMTNCHWWWRFFCCCWPTCAGHEPGSEAAVYAMKELFEAATSEALVDASNAFICINCQPTLHNISKLCPSFSTILQITYCSFVRLFVVGEGEIFFNWGHNTRWPLCHGHVCNGCGSSDSLFTWWSLWCFSGLVCWWCKCCWFSLIINKLVATLIILRSSLWLLYKCC